MLFLGNKKKLAHFLDCQENAEFPLRFLLASRILSEIFPSLLFSLQRRYFRRIVFFPFLSVSLVLEEPPHSGDDQNNGRLSSSPYLSLPPFKERFPPQDEPLPPPPIREPSQFLHTPFGKVEGFRPLANPPFCARNSLSPD